MIDGEDGHTVRQFLRFPMGFRDAELCEEMPEGVSAERDDHCGLDERDLELEPGHALLLLFRSGVTIAGRAELHDIADVDVGALEADGAEEFIEELTCRTYKWSALLIFLLPGGFTDEHDLGMGIAFAEDGLGCGFVEVAAFPFADFLLEVGEGEGHEGNNRILEYWGPLEIL